MRSALERDVRALARSEGRVPGTDGHARAREYLIGRMRDMRLQPWAGPGLHLPYRDGGFEGHNLVGVLPGSDRRLAPILLGAHYDSVLAAPCADDNAAAVAIALAAAALLGPGRMRRDLALAFFDAEEPPYTHTPLMGSVRFYDHQLEGRRIHCALVQDLTGHDVSLPLGAAAGALAGLVFVTGAESHADLPAVLRRCVRPQELPVIATLNSNVGDVSDHGVFRARGVPYLFLSCGHWEHYHKPTDTPDRLNYGKMERIALMVGRMVEQLDGQDLPQGGGPADTAAFEVELLRLSLGPLLGPVLALAGLTQASSREHLDQFAARLQAAGL